MWCDFNMGEQVVCVDDDFGHLANNKNNIPNKPQKNRTYTIRGMRPAFIKKQLTISLLLVELVNPEGEYITPMGFQLYEPGFDYRRFKRAEKKKNEEGMKMLRSILDDVPKQVTIKEPEKVE